MSDKNVYFDKFSENKRFLAFFSFCQLRHSTFKSIKANVARLFCDRRLPVIKSDLFEQEFTLFCQFFYLKSRKTMRRVDEPLKRLVVWI